MLKRLAVVAACLAAFIPAAVAAHADVTVPGVTVKTGTAVNVTAAVPGKCGLPSAAGSVSLSAGIKTSHPAT